MKGEERRETLPLKTRRKCLCPDPSVKKAGEKKNKKTFIYQKAI
jgi:hypothetical protein